MKAVDDVGRAYTPVSISELGRDPRMADQRFRLMLERTTRAQLMNAPRWRVVLPLAFASPFVIVGTALLLRSVLPMSILLLVPMLIVAGLLIASRRFIRARSRSQVGAVLLKHGVCPGCGYDLPSPGGEPLTCCPECGCLWRSDRVHSSHDGSGFAWGDKPTTTQSVQRFKSQMDIFGPRRATDARGRLVPLVSSRLRRQLDATTDEYHRGQLLVAQTALRHHGLVLRSTAAAAVGAFGLLSLAARVLPNPAPYGNIVGAGVMCVCCGFFTMSILRSSLGVTRGTLINIMLSNRLCPTCGANLVDATESGGTVRAEPIECRDCGAAWNPGPPVTSHPPVA